MEPETPFNPLDKKNLGISVADALLDRPVHPLPPSQKFLGAGVYAIYYTGSFSPYSRIAAVNKKKQSKLPIYVGKAVPSGARKGGFELGLSPGTKLYERLSEHASSIVRAENLNISDFHCRYIIVDDIWIPLGETLLIERFSPIWNQVLDGFGNHDPGKGRYNQQRSLWDVIHPGRSWVRRLQPNKRSNQDIILDIELFFQSKDWLSSIEKLPSFAKFRKD